MKEKIVRIIKKIFFLPPVATLMIAIPSFAFLIVALTRKLGIPALNYTAYILSAYALVISITGISKIVTLARNGVSEHPFMKWLLSVPVVEKMIHENQFRTEIALYPGFCINVLYVIFKTATGIYYRSGILIRRNTEEGK